MIAVLYSHTMFKRLTVVHFPQLLALCRQNNGFCRAELHVYKIENPFARFWNFLKLWLITFVSHNEALQGSLFLIKLLVRFLKIWLITFVSVSKTLQGGLFVHNYWSDFLCACLRRHKVSSSKFGQFRFLLGILIYNVMYRRLWIPDGEIKIAIQTCSQCRTF